jgi:hypothetical protein
MSRDPLWPSEATSEGQMLRFTESLGRSRYGRPIALVMPLGGAFLAVVIALSLLRG